MDPSAEGGWVREPAVAGRFYPGDARAVERELARHMPAAQAAPATAVIVPHAGWMYSGAVAGAVYARVEVPARAIIVCPNHTGRGVRRSVWASGVWRLPGGDVPVDGALARAVCESAGMQADRGAHLGEHAAEVHLPFLRARRPDVAVVPVCLVHLTFEECERAGQGLAQAVRAAPGPVLLVASTDMSHYVPAETARRLDRLALDRVEAMDPRGLHETVEANDLSMCGYIPTTVVLAAAVALGAKTARLVRYGHSGETSGDDSAVVGYAGLVVDES